MKHILGATICGAFAIASTTFATVATDMVGNDRDAHGCIGSAGYSWSESAGLCVRSWEAGSGATVQKSTDDVKICTMEYAPVCGKVQVQCLRAPCYPVYKTFSNSCMMSGEGKFAHNGACTANEEGGQAVLSETTKKLLQSQFDRFVNGFSSVAATEKLAIFQRLDARIATAIESKTSTGIQNLRDEMKADRLRASFLFLQGITQSSIHISEGEIAGKRYIVKDPLACQVTDFRCSAGETMFTDDYGCGCKK